MTFYASGPELVPLMVYLVDYPIAYFTMSGDPPILAYGIPIVICSIVYPTLIYLVGRSILLLYDQFNRRFRAA
jgi:hypothetical protein